MRWLFAETDEEKKYRYQVEQAIHYWWNAFEQKREQIENIFLGGPDFGLPQWMQENLGKIHPGLDWEFGSAIQKKGYHLAMTAGVHIPLRPMLDTLLSYAPKLQNWEFYSYKQADPLPVALEKVLTCTGVDATEWVAQIRPRNSAWLDLRFCTNSRIDEQQENCAFLLAESLLGEEIIAKRVAVIDVVTSGTPDANHKTYITLSELRQKIDSITKDSLNHLPAIPYRNVQTEDLPWYEVSLNPSHNQDYSGFSDLKTTGNCVPGFLEAVRMPAFYSDKFSRTRETFCYVKIDDARNINISTLRKTLDALLRKSELGCIVGLGSGIRYFYFDVALTNVKQGAHCIRTVLREYHVSKRSWLLFIDECLLHEWVGIYPDTPLPPIGDENELISSR